MLGNPLGKETPNLSLLECRCSAKTLDNNTPAAGAALNASLGNKHFTLRGFFINHFSDSGYFT